MPGRIINIILIIIALMACDRRPSSRLAVVRLDNDNISDLEKIRLFEEQADNLSGSAYAAIASLYANSGNIMQPWSQSTRPSSRSQ